MRRCLLVSPVSPFSEASGGQQRSRLLYTALQQTGLVDVLVLGARGVRCELADGAAAESPSRRGAALSQWLASSLPLPLEHYALIVVRYASSLRLLHLPASARYVVDLDDYSFRMADPVRHLPAAWLAWVRKGILRRVTRTRLQRACGLIFPAVRDMAGVVTTGGQGDAIWLETRGRIGAQSLQVAVLPNVCPPVGDAAASAQTALRLLVVGSMWYAPNRDGVRWFLRAVWPALCARHVGLQLQIVGATPAVLREEWRCVKGVEVSGFVPDLGLAYAQASVVVVPVQSGGGSPVKLLEALGHGRPCVASRFASEPYSAALRGEEHLLVADDADDFIRHCERLLTAPALGRELGSSGREIIRREFAESRFIEAAKRFFESCAA